MQVIEVTNKQQIRKFRKFRKKLYQGDPFYVSTVEFTVDMLLFRSTQFAARCVMKPVMIEDNGKTVAEGILIKYPYDDFVQIAFFEALENQENAVELIKDKAKAFAEEMKVNRIIVGLNGHLSYGVGLSLDMNKANTFDSMYSKLYYPDYFRDAESYQLVAFRNRVDAMVNKLSYRPSRITVRPIDFSCFSKEMAFFKEICDATIGKTFLYSPTEERHFEELIGQMKFFLRPENLLLAFDGNEAVGFLFWHPDYNEILKKGKQNSLISIACRYSLFKKKITTFKINSIGVKPEYRGFLTCNLLYEMSKYVRDYIYAETNFVWRSNFDSMSLNEYAIKKIERNFAVYEYRI